MLHLQFSNLNCLTGCFFWKWYYKTFEQYLRMNSWNVHICTNLFRNNEIPIRISYKLRGTYVCIYIHTDWWCINNLKLKFHFIWVQNIVLLTLYANGEERWIINRWCSSLWFSYLWTDRYSLAYKRSKCLYIRKYVHWGIPYVRENYDFHLTNVENVENPFLLFWFSLNRFDLCISIQLALTIKWFRIDTLIYSRIGIRESESWMVYV